MSIDSFTQMCNKHPLHTVRERYINTRGETWGQRNQFFRNLQSKQAKRVKTKTQYFNFNAHMHIRP